VKLFKRRGGASPSPTGEMTLFEHLAELRMRIVRSALAIMIGAIVVMAFYNQVLNFLIGPYQKLCDKHGPEYCGLSSADENVRLFILDPIEGLATRLKIAFYGGIALASPVVLWQIWKFVVPALHKNERRYALGFVLSTLLLFCGGGVVAYFTLEPALEFLISWSGQDINQAFQVEAYVRLILLMFVAFGVGFTIPVLLTFLELIGVLKPQQLLGWWRYAIVLIVFIAAAITPSGDPISLAALAVPMVVLYFLAILVGWIHQRARRRRQPAGES
jgi:sec-independent protein translocase protein TatC